jgi:hypothetical protein
MRRFLALIAALAVFAAPAFAAPPTWSTGVYMGHRSSGAVTPAVFKAGGGLNTILASGGWSIPATGAVAGDGLFINVILYHAETAPVFMITGSSATATVVDTTVLTPPTGDGTYTGVTYAYTLQAADISAGVVAATYTQATSGNSMSLSAVYHGATTLVKKSFNNTATAATSISITGYTPGGTSKGALAFIGQRLNGNAGSGQTMIPDAAWTARINDPTGSPFGASGLFIDALTDKLIGISGVSYSWTNWFSTGYETVFGVIFDLQ